MIEVRASEIFIRVSKRLVKKYASFEDDYLQLVADLENNTAHAVDLGSGLKKVRMAITSKGKGKSGSARVVTFDFVLSQTDKIVNLLTIYDKSECENITKQDLLKLKKKCGF